MRKGFQIELQCPQCGAPATLEETDRLFTCSFCRVRSYLAPTDVFRYVLPHKELEKELTHLPYWRFRGVFYTCTSAGVRHRIVDSSMQAVESRFFPRSLGLRAQTMKLTFATSDVQGRFVRPNMSPQDARKSLSATADSSQTVSVHHQEFIGDTLSLIYAPFYLDGKVFDGVLGRAVSPVLPENFDAGLLTAERPCRDAEFIPTLCPRCGWDLEGERDSLVLTCRNCASAWKSTGQRFSPVQFGILGHCANAVVFLPFWRIRAVVSGLQLSSYADLVKVANLPTVTQEGWEVRGFHFWAPAFKVRPKTFLRLARLLTLSQPQGETVPEMPQVRTYPVTLPLQEATETMKVVLASFVKPPQVMYPRLPQIHITPQDALLVFIPFSGMGSQLAQPKWGLTVNKSSLRYGLLL